LQPVNLVVDYFAFGRVALEALREDHARQAAAQVVVAGLPLQAGLVAATFRVQREQLAGLERLAAIPAGQQP
jgi:hypothetical protein